MLVSVIIATLDKLSCFLEYLQSYNWDTFPSISILSILELLMS